MWCQLGSGALSWRGPLECLTLEGVLGSSLLQVWCWNGARRRYCFSNLEALVGVLFFVFCLKLLLCARCFTWIFIALATTPWEKWYYSHFTDEGTEAQRGEITWPRSYSRKRWREDWKPPLFCSIQYPDPTSLKTGVSESGSREQLWWWTDPVQERRQEIDWKILHLFIHQEGSPGYKLPTGLSSSFHLSF